MRKKNQRKHIKSVYKYFKYIPLGSLTVLKNKNDAEQLIVCANFYITC